MTPAQITLALAAVASLYLVSLYLEHLMPPCPQHRPQQQQIRDRSTTSTDRNPQIEERDRLY